ncbi:MAG TPA: peptide chain release factor N(5)-glutamine methyltransferase [Castellaniella sp.]|uniref:peptide chain release factor N(5)-glutamine methyltransferase n=1 Tax=Castellaniella sp. TaxID=1955812 RepID=UPI002EFD6329
MKATLREWRAHSTLPLLEFHLLWQHVLGVSRAWLIAHDTDVLDATQCKAYEAFEARRMAGEPMAYILGQREFLGRDFKVTPAVLIPRPETELLVECGLAAVAQRQTPHVLDLGTGSGVVAISMALARPDALVQATDQSDAALSVAQMNAQALGAKLLFSLGNWYDTCLEFTPFDVIVSNPPYIQLGDAHLACGDLRFEPQVALTDGSDGLSALRIIVQGAPARLAAGGSLIVEHGFDQASAVRALFRAQGFEQVASMCDLAGIERVTGGRLPA